MKTDITALDRRFLIQLALNVHDVVCAPSPRPLYHVKLADFEAWMDIVDAGHCFLRLRRDSTIEVDAVGSWQGNHVQVCTTADMARGLELPAVPEDRVTSPSAARLPVDELWRLELLREVAS